MPNFKLIKEPENTHDSEVVFTFDTDIVGVAQAHFNDFLKASGFELPLEETDEPIRLSKEDFLAREEDWMWDDAFDFKFRNDGLKGSLGADIIQFPVSDS